MTKVKPMLDAALDYAMRGWPVFPCRPADKKPLTEHGFKDATVDPARIMAWWGAWPEAMIGLPTGAVSGIAVLDVDAGVGKVGQHSLATLMGEAEMPAGLRVRTPGGGCHYYFEMPGFALGCSTSAIGRDLDIRANGGYVIAAPSVNAAGLGYVRDGSALPGLPEWLLAALTAAGETKPAGAKGSGREEQRATVAEVRAVLVALPNDPRAPWCDSYAKWQRVCAAIKGALGEEGFWLWMEWNEGVEQGPGYEPEKKWREAGADYIGWVALRKLAEAHASAEGFAEVRNAEAGRTFDDGEVPPEAMAKAGGAPLDAYQYTVAKWIARSSGKNVRFNRSTREWMQFTGDRWETATVDLGFRLAQKWVDECGPGTKEAAKAGFCAGVSTHLRNMPAMVVSAGDFDRGRWLLGVPGGVLELRTGRLRPGKAADMISRAAAAAPGGDCPLWKKFVGETCQGDMGLAGFLQRWAGYCLTGDVAEHTFLYTWGPGGNGKSLYHDTVRGLLGGYGVQASPELFVKRSQKGHPDALARLAGARLVVVPEISGGDKWDVDLLKEVTGNELLTARFMYGSNFEFPVTFKLASSGNHQPAFPGGVTPAIRRRFAYGKFENVPKVVDRQLAEKFKGELGGIMAWALEGLRMFLAGERLTRPACMQSATEEYFADVDPVQRWMAENLERDAKARTPMKEMFENWESWSLSNGVHEHRSLTVFSRMVRQNGVFEILNHRNVSTVKGWKIRSPF